MYYTIKELTKEEDYKDERVITRGELVRLFDLMRAQCLLDEARKRWETDDEAVRDRATDCAKASLMTGLIDCLKEGKL